MKLRIVSILFMTLLIAQMPMTVFAATVSLDIDKTEISASQELEVSGTATDLEEVLIKIVAPDEAVYFMDVLTVEDGEFQSTIGFPTTANGDTAGDYTIIVGNDEIQDITTVTLTCEEDCDDGGEGNNGDDSDNDEGEGNNGNDSDNNEGEGNNGDNSDNGEGEGNNGDDSDNGEGEGNNGDDSDNNEGEGNNGNNSNNNNGEGNNGGNSNNNNGKGNNGNNSNNNDGEGNLPNTSTSIFNFLITGLMLLVVGSGVVFYQKKKKA
ncbi:LPXTG-motif cell wall anchor domain-containing protein [Gracilibacillus orientalis]|uniref:LPXTG-motif cell wall anchor domain-containing protein n=1 Tax=Gracilibacillus orientalis TaxID=334253 RepID=A0A1I4PFR5_9BACI|nr:LPXTG cell wall anchor domain-containing protein [Gracilibacillus orientalis]SFM26425.1 LPXTG-motif cell wall anchor domain-containing protein [Gracilibacillus orientalis]